MARIAAIAAAWLVVSATPVGATLVTVDPSVFPDNTNLTGVYLLVTLIADVPATPPGDYVSNSTPPGEPTMFTMFFSGGSADGIWTDSPTLVRIFEARFLTPTRFVSVRMREGDLLGSGGSQGVLEAYDGGGGLLHRVVVPLTSTLTYQNVVIVDLPGRIASVRAYGTGSSFNAGANLSSLQFDLLRCLSPGAFPDNTNLTSAYEGVTLIADLPTQPPGTFVTNGSAPGEPTQFIMRFMGGSLDNTWTDSPGLPRIFEARFAAPMAFVAVSMRDADLLQGGSQGVLEAYDGGGALLGRVDAPLTSTLTYQVIAIAHPSGNIASIRAYGTGGPSAGANLSSLCLATPLVLVDVPIEAAPTGFQLAPSRPNPFSGSTTIAYDLAEPTFVTLVIHDVSGRRVRVLDEGARGPGRHVSTWDGKDAAGRRMAAGCYFYRLETTAGVRTRRLVLLR